MHLIITDAWMAKSRPIHLTGTKLALLGVAASLVLMMTAVSMYHWIFLKGAQEGWPILSSMAKLVKPSEVEQRDRFLRENLEVLAQKVGEMQAKLLQMESLAERISSLAGIPPPAIKEKTALPGSGGPLVANRNIRLEELLRAIDELQTSSERQADQLTAAESQLYEKKVKDMAIPTQLPILYGHISSGFGLRMDPFTNKSAMHTGLDFPAEIGTPILATAGGLVITQEYHNEYGNVIEVDHGNNLSSRYAHLSKAFVKKGDFIKRGQRIALVGTSGRSTGPHLHYEVLVGGVPQDPRKFLNAGLALKNKR